MQCHRICGSQMLSLSCERTGTPPHTRHTADVPRLSPTAASEERGLAPCAGRGSGGGWRGFPPSPVSLPGGDPALAWPPVPGPSHSRPGAQGQAEGEASAVVAPEVWGARMPRYRTPCCHVSNGPCWVKALELVHLSRFLRLTHEDPEAQGSNMNLPSKPPSFSGGPGLARRVA